MGQTMRPLALVTGASSGLGAVFARQLAARGYDLVLVARRLGRIEALGQEIATAHGVRAESLAADLATDAGLAAVESRIAQSEALELLVNNAGFGTLGKFFEIDMASQDAMHRLHVLAPMRLTHAALAGMVRRGRGGVINVASVAGFAAAPGSVSYCTTKRWMIAFTEGLDLELKGAGSAVKVQALCPGYTYTEFHDTLGYDRGRIPKFLWLNADFVVRDSLRGLDRDRILVVPGWQYKVIVAMVRILPMPLLRAISTRQQKAIGRG